MNRIYVVTSADVSRFEQWYSDHFSLQELSSRGRVYSRLATALPFGWASQHVAEVICLAVSSNVGLSTMSLLVLVLAGYRSGRLRPWTPSDPVEAAVTFIASAFYGLLLTEGIFFHWLAPMLGRRLSGRKAAGPWRWQPRSLGVYGWASLMFGGLFELPWEEVLEFFASTDDKGEWLRASREYRLSMATAPFPQTDGLKVHGSDGLQWSLTVYGSDGFLLANNMGKYSVGSASARQANDSWSLILTHRNPDEVGCSDSSILPLGNQSNRAISLSLRFYRLGAVSSTVVEQAQLPTITRMTDLQSELFDRSCGKEKECRKLEMQA
eukprot:CAMPEP_0171140964 /NCGR_PEP_ID=MMETSP0766_2-20121228/139749_1 /TAXON_ID=439317 /ORGANISM="Gambierdiscus australes, Strain CAWD 149" /LENGTH=323 /DNA_ID=CAMNT_0011604677 /DNA_START=28 /DNA_END=996 /DNA_ORIENTATION=-